MKEKVDLEVGVASSKQMDRRYEDIIEFRAHPVIEGTTFGSSSLKSARNILDTVSPK